MSKAQRNQVASRIRRNAVNLFTVTVTGHEEARGEEDRGGVHFGADHAVLPAFFLLCGHLSSLVCISAKGHLALLLPISSLFIGILGHEHLNPEHDHSSH